jgi:nucleoside-diphosphate-sugar epimerase
MSKLEGERALAAAAGEMRPAIVRPAIVYGPHDRDVLVLFKLVARGFAPYTARRDTRVSFIHARDLADLLILAGESAPSGRVYLASDGVSRTWADAIGAVAGGMGRRARALRIHPACLVMPAALVGALRWALPRPPLFCLDKVREAAASWVASPVRARAELGWEPRLGLEEGARMTAEWYREKGWL